MGLQPMFSSVCEKTTHSCAVFAPIVCFAGTGLLVRTVVVACPPYNRAPGTLACKPVLASLARSDLNESEERETQQKNIVSSSNLR